MKNLLLAFVVCGTVLGGVSGAVNASGNDLDVADKIALQSSLLAFLEQGGDEDGSFRVLDRKTGVMIKAHIGALHPKIIRLGPDYVLCIEMFDANGQRHEADFIMRPGTAGWVVTDVLFDQRDLLKKARQQLK